MGHKYLEELEKYYTWDEQLPEDDDRRTTWDKEKEIYGFDSRETWDLDHTFFIWLYERLRMYQDTASEIIDLNYHKFTFKGEEFTQGELIDKMLERLRFYFSDKYDDWDKDNIAYVKEVAEIWAVVLPAMWW